MHLGLASACRWGVINGQTITLLNFQIIVQLNSRGLQQIGLGQVSRAKFVRDAFTRATLLGGIAKLHRL